MQIVYRFKIHPTLKQQTKMFEILKFCRKLYNQALEEWITTYKETGKGLTYLQQQKALPAFAKAKPEYKGVHSQVLQDVLRRLDFAFGRFFAQEARHPRFKNRDHYQSFTYPQVDAVKKTFSRPGFIFLSKIDFVKMETHRYFPAGAVSMVNVKHHGRNWHVQLTTEIPEAEPIPVIAKTVGIDVGRHHFAALSDGTVIDPPKYFRKSEQKLARAQRRLSRKKKGSHNRGKARVKVTRIHDKVANQRKDFLHKASLDIVQSYDLIVGEDLRISNMVRNHHLAKSIHDAGWGMFRTFIEYKSRRFGKHLILVNPAGTSQECICGEEVPKDLSIRVHHCPACGLVEDRDVMAAKVIEKRGILDLTA